MAFKLWLSLCLLLFGHNLMCLINDRYTLNYKIVEEGDVFFDKDDDLNYLACTPFWRIEQLDLSNYEPATKNVSVNSFLRLAIESIERRLNVTSLFRLNESYILHDTVCFSITKSDLEREEEPFNRFLAVYETFSIFIYSKEKQPNAYERAYWKNDDQPSIYLRTYRQKVFAENHLLNPDCLDRASQIHYDRFSCLNRCFIGLKIKNRFYRFDDEAFFNLSEIVQKKHPIKRKPDHSDESLKTRKLETLNEIVGAEDCLKKCPESACFWEIVISLRFSRDYYEFLREEDKNKLSFKLNTYAAFYSMDDFYLQLLGLLALFTGTSGLTLMYALLALTVRKLETHLKNDHTLSIVRSARLKFKSVLTLLSFLLVLMQSLKIVYDFKFHSSQPNRTTTLNFSSEPFSLVFCFPIENSEQDEKIEEGRNSELLKNLSFTSIEKYSNDLKDTEIFTFEAFAAFSHVNLGKRFSEEVLFKGSTFENKLCLSRCFRLDHDSGYREMQLVHLLIVFTTRYRELFLVGKNESFTSGLVNFRGSFNPQKMTKQFSAQSKKSNCKDYSREAGCGSRRHCIDRCLGTKFIEKHGSIPTNTMVRKEDLNPSWLDESVYFNETVDREIEEECNAQFNLTDCVEAYFEESPELSFSGFDWQSLVRLRYLNIVEKEMEYTPVKTFLDIVGVETIFFGSNALGVLTVLPLSLSKILRLKWHRAYNVILFLVAGACLLTHSVLVFQSIVCGDLNENEFFEKPEQYQPPSPVLCFPIEEDIDENHRLTGEYLNDLTKETTFKQIFRKISYNNRTHDKALYTSRLNSTRGSIFYSTPELELTHFYYFNQKCFKLSLKVSYREEDFFLLEDKTVLRAHFNRDFAIKRDQALLFYQQVNSGEIGGGYDYKISKRVENEPDVYYNYRIELELFRIVRVDQFELLKDPRRLFQQPLEVNDVKSEEAMRRQFKDDYNLTTKDLPLDRDFDVETDDELFDQHSNTVISQAGFKSLNFERNVANLYVSFLPSTSSGPEFAFSISFLVRRVEITNAENYTKFVLSVLNTLSLWLGFCILDMGAWFAKMFSLAPLLYRLLVSTRNCIDNLRVSERMRRVERRKRKTRMTSGLPEKQDGQGARAPVRRTSL